MLTPVTYFFKWKTMFLKEEPPVRRLTLLYMLANFFTARLLRSSWILTSVPAFGMLRRQCQVVSGKCQPSLRRDP